VVSPGGEVVAVADDLLAPNGVALTEDGRTLVVAEAAGPRLTAFTVGTGGSLQDRRTFADLGPAAPAAGDGICLDAEGAVWLADPLGRQVIRVLEGGQITESVAFDEVPVACVLAGEDRRTLVCCVAPTWDRDTALEAPLAHLEAIEVVVPGSGRP
jgi:sugar lactone lactonase YvrE